ncbi:AAA family ATPase [uncultured Clostridium sp.]|uniref:AAA family ATPase n=1 Tax=uncultured Clostridium sp. TaxID=59620 RepID=UPI0026DD80E8|nr:AAA family ATPase [uncultured Clostridium sp.]
MNKIAKEYLNFNEYSELRVEEKLITILRYWGFEKNVFYGKVRKRIDTQKTFTFIDNLRNVDGQSIYNPFNGELISSIFCVINNIPKSKNIKEGDMVIFSVELSKRDEQERSPIKVDERNITKIDKLININDESKEYNIGEFGKLDKDIYSKIIEEVNRKFLRSNDIFKVYLEGSFKVEAEEAIETVLKNNKDNIISEILELKHKRDDLKEDINRINEEISKGTDDINSIKKQHDKINESIIKIEEKEKRFIKLGLIEEKKFESKENRVRLKGNVEKINHIYEYLYKRDIKPLLYKREILEQFFIGLHTNQIIILGGAPGSGKTSLVEGVAEAIGAECRMVYVRPNWNSAEDLLGFYNPMESLYIGTPMIDTIIEANENSEQLYFICLDEMNLGCVEHYFSDFLSALYSKNKEINLYSNEIYRSEMKIISEKLGVDKSKDEIINNIGIDEYARLERRYRNLEKYKPFINIPSNVRFIGTINRDATTKDLSPKVIDRSIIININSSFDTFEELIKLKENSESIEPIYISSDEIVSRSGDMNRAYIEFKKLIDIFNKNGLELNFRFLQTAASMLEVEGIERSLIIDYIIATKVLPKINLEVNEDNKFINELETILYNNKISEGIYKDIKDFYNENEIMTYWR